MEIFPRMRGVMRWALFFLLFLFIALPNSCDARCFGDLDEFLLADGSGGNIGYLEPREFLAIDEGIPLKLYCTLLQTYMDKNGRVPRDIFWQFTPDQDLSDQQTRTLKRDTRFDNDVTNATTAWMKLDKLQLSDSGSYKCVVEDKDHGESGKLVCSVTVNVGGPPKKYRDFDCESNDYKDLVCSFRRTDDYPGLSKTSYLVEYKYSDSVDWKPANCSAPSPSADPNEPTGSWYRCRWSTHHRAENHTLWMKGYPIDLRINGSNPLGNETWRHHIVPAEYVRPSAPKILTFKDTGPNSCDLTWKLEDTLDTESSRDKFGGLKTGIRYRKTGDEGVLWSDEIETDQRNHVLHKLDANTNYEVVLRARTEFSEINKTEPKWSRPLGSAKANCTTAEDLPGSPPGLVPGAYEVSGYGNDRQITLYWMGVPPNRRNGKRFQYKISIKESGRENRNLENSPYANVLLDVPFNSSVKVTVTPDNSMGPGPSETTEIFAVHDPPLVISNVNVAVFEPALVEVAFESNEDQVDWYDIFYCKTSLETHLARCTDTMEHEKVLGNITRKAYNVTRLEKGKNYRFAVAASKGGRFSGMTWARRFCSQYDQPRLDGILTISAPSSEGSVNVSWAAPCQQRFLPRLMYQLDYYPCSEDHGDRCASDKTIFDLNTTVTTIEDLAPKSDQDVKRYCFRLSVIDAKTRIPYPQTRLLQCMSIPHPPAREVDRLAVILGAVGGAVALAIIVVFLMRLIKRMRKNLKEMEKESRNINFPAARPDKLDDEFEIAPYYSKIDSGEKNHAYLRQLSDNSGNSSGHGSLSSNSTVMNPWHCHRPRTDRKSDFTDVSIGSSFDVTAVSAGLGILELRSFCWMTLEKTVDDSGVISSRKRDLPVRHSSMDRRSPDSDKHRHSNVDLSTARDVLQSASDSAETVSLGRSSSPRLADIGNLKIHLSLKKPVRRPPSLTHTATTDLDSSAMNSGYSGASEDPSSFGYVAASSLQATVSNSSSSAETGETGYVSHPGGLSDSHDGTGQTALSAASSGFGDSESPVSRKWPTKPVMESKLSYQESDDDPGNGRFGQAEFDNRSPVSSAPSSPVTTTRLLKPNMFPKVDVNSGYVAAFPSEV